MNRRREHYWQLYIFTVLVALAGYGSDLLAGDELPPIHFNFGSFVAQASDATSPPVGERNPAGQPPQLIEIGGFGEPRLPDNVRQMMKAAQELQAMRAKYDATVTDLIESAKKLDDPDELMAGAAVVAALAKTAEELRKTLDAKEKEMMTKLGGGVGLFGGDAEIEAFERDELKVEIFPNGPLP